MQIVLTVVGALVIVVALQDMFHTLLHPRGKGQLSSRVLAGAWWLSRSTGHRLGTAVGPASMVAAIVVWVALLGVGWALVYHPHIPDGFVYSPGIDPADYSDLTEALYVSFVTLATLGFGDVVATDPLLRLAAPLEALTGFAVLTAALTWFMQIYPPLTRRRTLALQLSALADVDYAEQLPGLDATTASRVLDAVTDGLRTVRIDFAQHSEGFYFPEKGAELNLARQLPTALRLRDAAQEHAAEEVTLSAQQLDQALEQLTTTLREQFLHTGEDPAAVVMAYAAEHLQTPRC